MDDFNRGDLADVVRAGGGGGGGASDNRGGEPEEGLLPPPPESSWQFPPPPPPPPPLKFSSFADDVFGDPFSDMRDPFLHEDHNPDFVTFFSPSKEDVRPSPPPPPPPSQPIIGNRFLEQEEEEEEAAAAAAGEEDTTRQRRRPYSIFSRMLQISPHGQPPASPAVAVAAPPAPPEITAYEHVISGAGSSSTTPHGLQISSALHHQGASSKRRKSQAKKVVCIPAPAPASSRPSSGEVVPSDLWAWRKYGQKPIKGSPYPRGYYRCSSSKGCSARKQVERSRTDPNMLVITYTSEHNHPWPTQRNALAGSTRAQPSKTSSTTTTPPASSSCSHSKTAPAGSSSSSSSVLQQPQTSTCTTTRDEEDANKEDHPVMMIKKSDEEGDDKMMSWTKGDEPALIFKVGGTDQEFLLDDDGELSEGLAAAAAKPEPDCSGGEDLFAELGEIEVDPLSNSLLFTQGFGGGGGGGHRALDPFFSLFDWNTSSPPPPSSSGRGGGGGGEASKKKTTPSSGFA